MTRRAFDMPPDDIESLESYGWEWETLHVNGQMVLLIHNYPIPEGYSPRLANTALVIPAMYPSNQIDMAHFYPHLSIDAINRPLSATERVTPSFTIDGCQYQQWSRHRNGSWRGGIDGIDNHLAYVNWFLKRELQKHNIS